MSALWTRDEALAATGGRAEGGDWAAMGVSIDTRTLVPGDLFVALKDQRDGHDFVAMALEKGASAALVSYRPDGVPADAPLLIVADVLRGLEALGSAGRARSNAKVIAVTGSVGKTSTKDMLAHVLCRQGRCHAAEASYNNHWGVPLTLARMPRDSEFAVIEIGMNHPGEIAPLARLARPHVAIVTIVAPAHMEAFQGIEGIAEEKASIFEGLEPGGVALFNADVETAPILNAVAKSCAAKRIGFGEAGDAALRAETITLLPESSILEGRMEGHPFLMKIGAAGRHHALNALAVYGAVHAGGADADVAALDMATWGAPAGRGARARVVIDANVDAAIELIDDAYNANPTSMAAGFDVLAAADPVGTGRRVLILGDMLELGLEEMALHAALADHPAMVGIAEVHCVGSRMKALFNALPVEKRGHWCETAADLAAEAHHLVRPGDVVLVKGSKGSRVSLLVAAIKALGEAREKGA